MAIALKSVANLNTAQIVDTLHDTALRLIDTAKATADKAQAESRVVLSRQVLKGAQRANDLSKVLFVLSQKIAPQAKPAAKAAPKARAAAKKPAAKRTRKAVAA